MFLGYPTFHAPVADLLLSNGDATRPGNSLSLIAGFL
jgi:hypothetical protein